MDWSSSEAFPHRYSYGPWIFEWRGGRLMDVYHRNNPTAAVHSIPATDYDWQAGQPRYEEDPKAEMEERARRWADEEGATYEENAVPYQQRDEEADWLLENPYPTDTFPSDWEKKSAEEDSWTQPRSDKIQHNVQVPGNAPGLNPRGDLPGIHHPCYCGVGLLSPHEWKPGRCEYEMPMRKAAAVDQNWVYFDGQVGFGRHWWEIIQELAQGHDVDTQNYLANMISRNALPPGTDLAVGTMVGGKPQIYSSNVDRNAVYDTVTLASKSAS